MATDIASHIDEFVDNIRFVDNQREMVRLRIDPDKRDDPRQGGRRRGSSCISPGGSG
jgi:hypothetical protein